MARGEGYSRFENGSDMADCGNAQGYTSNVH